MALTKVLTGGIADDAIGNTKLALDADYAFTGTISGAGLASPFPTGTAVTSVGGAATTNIAQGLAKMWIHFNGSGSQGVGDSFNHSSITDDGTGKYTIAITNDMANDAYSPQYTAKAVNNNSGEATYVQTFATGSCSIKHYENGTNYDSAENTVTIHGDLA